MLINRNHFQQSRTRVSNLGSFADYLHRINVEFKVHFLSHTNADFLPAFLCSFGLLLLNLSANPNSTGS